MFAAEEYQKYVNSGDKSHLESVVTLENSENNHQEYFKRLLLRRIFMCDDLRERQAEVLLRRWGIMHAPQSIDEIGQEFGVTRERIRQIEAKALHKIQYPDKAYRDFLLSFTTREEYEKALAQGQLDNPLIAGMLQLNYDKTTSKAVADETINYGIVYGNEKIVFIKTGADGSIRGYQDKYLRMARRIHDRLGATVICASNPYIEVGHDAADRAMISEVAAAGGFAVYEVYFVGTSDGGYHNLLLAQAIPQTVKLIGINTSLNTVDDLVEKLQAIPNVKKLLVYGTEDDDYESVSLLQTQNYDNLEILTVEGANHQFRGRLEEYIALVDLL